MAVTAHAYALGLLRALTGAAIDWDSDTIKVALVKSTYTPDWDGGGNYTWSHVSSHEASGDGYTAGGKTLANASFSATTSGSIVATLDADDVSWTDATITARYAVLYQATGNEATSTLIAYVDFGEDKSCESGTFSITWDADGILKLAVS